MLDLIFMFSTEALCQKLYQENDEICCTIDAVARNYAAAHKLLGEVWMAVYLIGFMEQEKYVSCFY